MFRLSAVLMSLGSSFHRLGARTAKDAFCTSYMISSPVCIKTNMCFFFSLAQIKRRPSEALPELLRPVTPITSFGNVQPQDSPSGLASLESGLSHLEVDDWDFWRWRTQWGDTCRIVMGNTRAQDENSFCYDPLVNNTDLKLKGVAVLRG